MSAPKSCQLCTQWLVINYSKIFCAQKFFLPRNFRLLLGFQTPNWRIPVLHYLVQNPYHKVTALKIFFFKEVHHLIEKFSLHHYQPKIRTKKLTIVHANSKILCAQNPSLRNCRQPKTTLRSCSLCTQGLRINQLKIYCAQNSFIRKIAHSLLGFPIDKLCSIRPKSAPASCSLWMQWLLKLIETYRPLLALPTPS